MSYRRARPGGGGASVRARGERFTRGGSGESLSQRRTGGAAVAARLCLLPPRVRRA